MDRSRQPIQRFMSAAPVHVHPEAKLADAARLMEDHDIRHLPVVQEGKVVGVVSERDMAIAETLVPNDWEEFPVAEAMTPEPHMVTPETLVCDVAQVMAEYKHGSVIVVDPTGKLLGIFTNTDALRVLAGERPAL